jgi:hypothetical protein
MIVFYINVGYCSKVTFFGPSLCRFKGLPVERDRFFTPTKTIGDYASEARKHSHIKA